MKNDQMYLTRQLVSEDLSSKNLSNISSKSVFCNEYLNLQVKADLFIANWGETIVSVWGE